MRISTEWLPSKAARILSIGVLLNAPQVGGKQLYSREPDFSEIHSAAQRTSSSYLITDLRKNAPGLAWFIMCCALSIQMFFTHNFFDSKHYTGLNREHFTWETKCIKKQRH